DRRGPRGERRGPGYRLERPARVDEGERLLAAAPEDERVAPLEPHDPAAAAAVRDEQRVDLLLPEPVARDAQRADGRLGDDLGCDDPVVDEHLAGAHAREPAEGDQLRVTGAGAD